MIYILHVLIIFIYNNFQQLISIVFLYTQEKLKDNNFKIQNTWKLLLPEKVYDTRPYKKKDHVAFVKPIHYSSLYSESIKEYIIIFKF